MKKYLRCHTLGRISEGLEVGKRYEITKEYDDTYLIEDIGYYTKEPDSQGLSYRTWFTLETEGDDVVMAKVLVADASIGGVLREYREVVRKANIGDRIIVTNPHHDAKLHGGYVEGDVAEVIETDVDSYTTYYKAITEDGKMFDIYAEEYRVLEPTGNVDVGGEIFRIVKRKAEEGEKVLVTSIAGANASGGKYYRVGNVAKVIRSSVEFTKIWADLTENSYHFAEGKWNIDDCDYHILVSVDKDGPDTKETDLESRVLELEARIADLEAKSLSRALADVKPAEAVETAQDTRDLAVEGAKELVKKIEDKIYGAWFNSPYQMHEENGPLTVEYVVNRDKRRVTAIIRLKHVDVLVVGVGRATCVEGDVFNEHLGKAIALLKALGEPVPREFTHAPQPTEVRLGNHIQFFGGRNGCVYEVVGSPSKAKGMREGNLRIIVSKSGHCLSEKAYGVEFEDSEILDDSKSEVFS